jgi:threonine dehydrogenase-like Zn-dependent dehydrogenase
MPRELVALAVRQPGFREYGDEPLAPGEIRVRTRYGAPKHGTELHMYRDDSPFGDSHWDPSARVFLPGASEQGGFPRALGNIAVGEVIEVALAAASSAAPRPRAGTRHAAASSPERAVSSPEGVAVGDVVAGYGPLRETQRWPWETPGPYPGVRKLPPGMSWQAAVCLDPTTVALGGVRDGGVRIGDRVAVFGLGAIGLVAVQLARIAGASFVAAVDPIELRRAVASRTGADVVLDPTQVDAGLEIRRATDGQGVDVAIESSGSGRALHHAIRGLAFAGTVAVVGWYGEIRGGLDLGREAHFNRPRLVFPRAESEPHYDHPRWGNRRQADAAWELLAAGRVACEEIVRPVVPFAEAAAAYREFVDEHPERSVKLGVVFGR